MQNAHRRQRLAFIVFTGVVVFLTVMPQIAASAALIDDNYYEDFTSSSPLEQKYSQRGTHEVVHTAFDVENPAIDTIGVWYPQALENDDALYPMIVVVNASNTPASSYEPYFERLASWGFIVVGTEDEQTGTGETTSITLDFMLNVPADSVLHDRIDVDNIGIVGYSQGGTGAIRAVTEFDNSGAYKALFTGSAVYVELSMVMGWEGYDITKVTIPYFMTAGTGSSDDTGVKDPATEFAGISPLSSLVANYNGMPDDVFKVRARVTDAEHEQMQVLTDGYMTAWMCYQLHGDPDAESVFVGDEAELLANPNWQDVEKNQ